MAAELPNTSTILSQYIVHQKNSCKYTRDGFNSRWQAAREAAIIAHPDISFDFTFHDLKAKGISDLDGTLQEKQMISGHTSIGQTARYDRKISVVPVVGGQETDKNEQNNSES